MGNEKKTNYWRFATILLIPLIMLLTILTSVPKEKETVDFIDFSITKEEFTAFTDVMETPFSICNIPTDKCAVISRIG